MSATRPAIEFSIGIIASAARAVGDGREGVLEACAGQRRHLRIGVAAGDVGIGAGLSLIGDKFGHASSSSLARGAQRVEVAFRIHRRRGFVQQRGVDAHAVLQRAELFEPFASLERRGGQADESLERRATKGVNAEMMIVRPLAKGRAGAREIERAKAIRAIFGCRPSSRRWDRLPPGERQGRRGSPMSTRRIARAAPSAAPIAPLGRNG